MHVRLVPPVEADDHILGPPRAVVTLVMFGDFECSWCGLAYPLVQQLRQAMGVRLRVVFRHFPVSRTHPHAQHAAEIAEGAAERGRFWEMHDILFEHQRALEDRDLVGYAASIGLDADWARAILRLHTCAEPVRRHFLSGVRSGVSGTPTFFINGIRYEDASEVAPLLLALQDAWRRTRVIRAGPPTFAAPRSRSR